MNALAGVETTEKYAVQMVRGLFYLLNQSACEARALELDEAYAKGLIGGGTLCNRDDLLVRGGSNETRCRLVWHQDVSGFRNVGESLLTLMEVATLQGWSPLMHRAMAARGQGLAPAETPGVGSALLAAAYFFIFVTVGGFLLMVFALAAGKS